MSADHSLPLAQRFVRKLDSVFPLTEQDRVAIAALPIRTAHLRADQDIVREGDGPSRSCIVLEGMACSFKVTGEGNRQILAFHIAGDSPDMQSLHLDVLDSSVGTVTPCVVGFVDHEVLRRLCERNHRIAAALWRTTLIDAAIFREWVTNVGQRKALSRVAHLLCEMVVRLRAAGLVDGTVIEFPITQSELGAATGLSAVHVNRTLQELRADQLIALKGTTLEVLDWDGLIEVGDFDPNYLHLKKRRQAVEKH